MAITKETWQAYIKACQDRGAECDRQSDEAYARGDLKMGAFWGRIAIQHYTAAEKASQELKPYEEPDDAVTPQP
jgi:hypothetical protein